MKFSCIAIGLLFIFLEFFPFTGSSKIIDLGGISAPEAQATSVLQAMIIEGAAEDQSASDGSHLFATAIAPSTPTMPNSITASQQLELEFGQDVTSGQLRAYLKSAGIQLALIRFDAFNSVTAAILPGGASGFPVRVDDRDRIRSFLEDHRVGHIWIEIDSVAATLAGVSSANQLLYRAFFIVPVCILQQFISGEVPLRIALQHSASGLKLVQSPLKGLVTNE